MRPSTDSLSTTAPQHLGTTCGQCHKAAARESFLHYRVHSRPGHPSEGPIIYGAWLFMNVLLFSVFTVFGLHTLFWFKRLLELKWAERQRYRAAGLEPPRRKRPLDSAAAGTGPWVWRFKLTHRIIHGVSVVSFFVLILTGLPLRFSCALWASDMMRLMGGP